MAIEIVDFPIKNGGSFQFAMLVYQCVKTFIMKIWPSYGDPLWPPSKSVQDAKRQAPAE